MAVDAATAANATDSAALAPGTTNNHRPDRQGAPSADPAPDGGTADANAARA